MAYTRLASGSIAAGISRFGLLGRGLHDVRFQTAVERLPEEAQRNLRLLRYWAKKYGYEELPNPNGGPEKWGVVVEGQFKTRLVIKPEGSSRPGIHPVSTMPRFEARIGPGANDWINPFTGEMGGASVGEHIWLGNPYLKFVQQMEFLENASPKPNCFAKTDSPGMK